MSPHPVFVLCFVLLCAAGLPPGFLGAASQASAQAVPGPDATPARLTAADIEAAEYHGGDLPRGQSAITARIQILLDRSGISPGVVDGWRGGMSESAIRAFQRRAGLSENGRMSPVVWQLLQPFAAEPLTMEYTITEEDGYGLVDNIPADYGEKARMTSQGYTSIAEKLAERFHMDERFLRDLNPGSDFRPGDRIVATVPAKPIRGKVSRIIVDKQTRRVAAYDARGRMLADYPATVGSDQTPSPHGTHTVTTVALDPVYTYNPHRNFKQGENNRVLTIPPGPNGPVGNVWIDLSEPTYGIHGTASPSRLFVNQSNGCVRLTNWDARELAHMVQPGVTVVEFLAAGTTIADVTARTPVGPSLVADAATTVARAINAARPLARPQSIILARKSPRPCPSRPRMRDMTPCRRPLQRRFPMRPRPVPRGPPPSRNPMWGSPRRRRRAVAPRFPLLRRRRLRQRRPRPCRHRMSPLHHRSNPSPPPSCRRPQGSQADRNGRGPRCSAPPCPAPSIRTDRPCRCARPPVP